MVQHLTIGLVAGPRHREISQSAPVRSDGRQIIGRVVGIGEIYRRRTAVAGGREDI